MRVKTNRTFRGVDGPRRTGKSDWEQSPVMKNGYWCVTGAREVKGMNGARRFEPEYTLTPPDDIRDLPQFTEKHKYFDD